MTRLVGTDGVIELGWDDVKVKRHKVESQPTYGGWDSFDTFSSSQQKEFEKWFAAKFPKQSPVIEDPAEMVYKAPEDYDAHFDHHANFIRCIREGEIPVEDAEFGLRAAAPSLAANVSYFENKIVKWDPVRMTVF
jgi:hypothetical protein